MIVMGKSGDITDDLIIKTFVLLLDNIVGVFKINERFTFQAIANAYVSVDSFFFLRYLSLHSKIFLWILIES